MKAYLKGGQEDGRVIEITHAVSELVFIKEQSEDELLSEYDASTERYIEYNHVKYILTKHSHDRAAYSLKEQ